MAPIIIASDATKKRSTTRKEWNLTRKYVSTTMVRDFHHIIYAMIFKVCVIQFYKGEHKFTSYSMRVRVSELLEYGKIFSIRGLSFIAIVIFLMLDK